MLLSFLLSHYYYYIINDLNDSCFLKLLKRNGNTIKQVVQCRTYVTYVLPDFLMSIEIARFACTCRFARDSMKVYTESWGIRLKAIASKHKMIISRDTTNKKNMKDPDRFYITDLNYHDAVMNQRMYRVEGTDNVFRVICKNGIGTAAELRNGWAHTNKSEYYEWVNRDDTIFTNPIPLLKTVCWYNPILSAKYIESGSYSLFVRHGLQPNHCFVECTSFEVILQVKRGQKEELLKEKQIYYNERFISQSEADHLSQLKKFDNTFITHFNTEDVYKFDQNEDSKNTDVYLELICKWLHNNDWWKDGYIIDGILLIPGIVQSHESSKVKKTTKAKESIKVKDKNKDKKMMPQKKIIDKKKK